MLLGNPRPYLPASLNPLLLSSRRQVGPNGAGKSTLLKLMTGALDPLDGMVKRHNHLRIGQYHQHLTELLPMELSPLQYMVSTGRGTGVGAATHALGLGRQGETKGVVVVLVEQQCVGLYKPSTAGIRGELAKGEACRETLIELSEPHPPTHPPPTPPAPCAAA